MKTENILLWGLGAFVAYKIFLQPKTTSIPKQPSPVYTPSGTTMQTTSSAGGSILALGTGLVTSIIKAINPSSTASATVSQPVSTGNTVDPTQQAATNDFISSEVSDIFSPAVSVAPSLISGIHAVYYSNINEDDLD